MKLAFFLLPLALAAPIADIANAPSAEERAVVPAPPEVEERQLGGGITGILSGLFPGLGQGTLLNLGVLNQLTGNLGTSLNPLPLVQVYSLVQLVQNIVASGGAPKVVPGGLPTSLTNAQFNAFIYNTQQILKGVPGIPAGLISSLGTIVGKIVPIGNGSGGAAPPGSTDLGAGLVNLVGQALKLLAGFDPKASPAVIGQNLGQLDAIFKQILGAIPTSSSGVDIGSLSGVLGQLVNNLAAYLAELQNPTSSLIQLPGQGAIASLGAILQKLAAVNGLSNVVANIASSLNFGGTNNLSRLLAQTLAAAFQLIQGLLQTLGLGNVLQNLLGGLNGGSGGGGGLGGLLGGLGL
ncbi:uncharacterized protein LOC62_06G008698 [Vanrija pseudolonga]|uniref:Uncharacterized protein n=1 Tax=Vanrija pseudolonga TaxID=143232 RepID=A0AAF1BQT9_9TREE|nr:hypothetical protein LOC62_06G008698 [Vanrija pseudolonga]